MRRNQAVLSPTAWPPWQTALLALAAAASSLVPPVVRAAVNAPLAGRYRIVQAASTSDSYQAGGMIDIDPRRAAYTVNWRLDTGKTLRGLGLSEGGNLIGASLFTGGVAHGLAIYRRADGGRRWQGQWITSIDSASIVGVMDFDADPKQPTLAGKHHFSGHRATTGQFDGTMTITPQGPDFMLTFTTAGGATLYRGIGILRGERLAVAWSFGSSPALAVYELAEHGELDGRRLSTRSRGVLQSMNERLVPADAVIVASGPLSGGKEKDARSKAGEGSSGGMSASEPGAPSVKAICYSDLMSRYGPAGWAQRWLDRQLTPDEMRLLQLAVLRHGGADTENQTFGSRTVAQLIEEQRRLQSP